MEKLIGWALTTLVSAFVGSYLAGYLKKKGENLATKEDIQDLAAQTALLTQTTKEIETKIESDLWDSQKRWEMRKDVITEAMRNVGSAQSTMARTVTALGRCDDAKTEDAKASAEQEAITCVEQCKDSVTMLAGTLTLIFLVSGAPVMDAFVALNNAHGDVIAAFKNSATRMEKFRQFSAAVGRLQSELRKELKIDK